jgi:hypothetical protein
MMSADWIGWLATAAFVSSYLFHRPATLRRIQAVAALLWLAYGVMIHSMPVIVANMFVAVAALWSSLHRKPGPVAQG